MGWLRGIDLELTGWPLGAQKYCYEGESVSQGRTFQFRDNNSSGWKPSLVWGGVPWTTRSWWFPESGAAGGNQRHWVWLRPVRWALARNIGQDEEAGPGKLANACTPVRSVTQ